MSKSGLAVRCKLVNKGVAASKIELMGVPEGEKIWIDGMLEDIVSDCAVEEEDGVSSPLSSELARCPSEMP